MQYSKTIEINEFEMKQTCNCIRCLRCKVTPTRLTYGSKSRMLTERVNEKNSVSEHKMQLILIHLKLKISCLIMRY